MSGSLPSDGEVARAELFSRIYFHDGWTRHAPTSAISVLTPLTIQETMTLDEIDVYLAERTSEHHDGLAAKVWEPLKEWTDEELAHLREKFPEWSDDDKEPPAEQVNAEDAVNRESEIAEMDRYCANLGIPPVRTMRDLLEFLIRCEVVIRSGDAEDAAYALNPAAPLPSEILPLSEDDRAREDEIRWTRLHDRTAQDIINLFQPDASDRLNRKKTSIEKLARELQTDPETARAGLVSLLTAGDFTVNRDPERVREHDVFELCVDWQLFARKRISITVGDSAADEAE